MNLIIDFWKNGQFWVLYRIAYSSLHPIDFQAPLLILANCEGSIHGKFHKHFQEKNLSMFQTVKEIVNESFQNKRNLNDQDRYNRLHEINPNIELLRTTFGLDLDS